MENGQSLQQMVVDKWDTSVLALARVHTHALSLSLSLTLYKNQIKIILI